MYESACCQGGLVFVVVFLLAAFLRGRGAPGCFEDRVLAFSFPGVFVCCFFVQEQLVMWFRHESCICHRFRHESLLIGYYTHTEATSTAEATEKSPMPIAPANHQAPAI